MSKVFQQDPVYIDNTSLDTLIPGNYFFNHKKIFLPPLRTQTMHEKKHVEHESRSTERSFVRRSHAFLLVVCVSAVVSCNFLLEYSRCSLALK